MPRGRVVFEQEVVWRFRDVVVALDVECFCHSTQLFCVSVSGELVMKMRIVMVVIDEY